MVSYNCKRCGKIFGHKVDYTRHINRKNPCKSNNESDNKITQIESQKNQKESKINPEESQNDIKKCENNEHKQKIYKCNYCNKILSTNSNYNRHISKFCKIKKQQHNDKENLLHKLLDEMKKQNQQMTEMKEEISKLKSENKKYVQNNNIATQNNISKQQNIQINNNNIKLLASERKI